MDSKELMQAFRDDVPVRFGDLVFSQIDGVYFGRARYNQYIADSEIKGSYPRRLIQRFLKIIQAKCIDLSGAEYWLNPKRLEIADPSEVTAPTGVDRILTNRLKLLDVFNAYCKEENLTPDLEGLILFLFAEDLINPGKAYDVVRAYERSIGHE